MADLKEFENKIYIRFLEEYSDILAKYFRKIAVSVASLDANLLYDVVKQALKETPGDNGKNNPPIIPLKKLKIKADKQFREDYSSITNSRIKQQKKAEELLALRTQDLGTEQREQYLKSMISGYTDFAASCKLIGRAEQFPVKYNEQLEKWVIESLTFEQAKKRAIDAGGVRNFLSHEKDMEAVRSGLNKDGWKAKLTVMSKAGLAFGGFEDESLLKLREKLDRNEKRIIGQMDLPPLDKNSLERISDDYDPIVLNDSYMHTEFDDENEILYCHSADEVREQIRKYTVSKEASKKFAEKEAALAAAEHRLDETSAVLSKEREQIKPYKDVVNAFANLVKDQLISSVIEQVREELRSSELKVSGTKKEDSDIEVAADISEVLTSDEPAAEPAEDLTEGISTHAEAPAESVSTLTEDRNALRSIAISRMFPNMKKYNGRPLSDAQLDELAEKTTMLADADFWMDKKNTIFLARKLIKYLKPHNRKLLLDWNTRAELFKYERNIGGDTSEKRRSSAKNAHNVMHMMVSRSYAAYMPATNVVCSSDYAIAKLAKENPDVMFTVFSNSQELGDRIINEGITNIIPVSYLAVNDMCIIRQNLKDPVRRIFNNNISIEDTSEHMQESAELRKKTPEQRKEPPEPSKEPEEVAAELRREETREAKEDTAALFIKDKKKKEKKKDHNAKEELSRYKINSYKLIEETNVLLPLDTEVKTGSKVFYEDGMSVTLGEELGEGGEGKVFACNEEGIVVKIYHRDKLTETRRDKLELMISNNPHNRKICWPEQLVYNENKQFVGYTMKSAAGYDEFGLTVLKLNSATVANKSMKGWDRLALVELCLDLCKTFREMHSRGILMGDVNPRNMMLNKKNTGSHTDYVLVDCDSYQLGGYPCPVGTTVFTSPKLYKRNNLDTASLNFGKVLRKVEDECYSIASLLFHILMLNQSPFAKKNGAENIEDAIRNYDFAYRLSSDDENTGAEVPDGAFRMIWNNMPWYIKNLFGDVFKDAKYVSVDKWIDALGKYRRDIEKGQFTQDLKPVLYYDPRGDFTVMFKCDLCGVERNMPKERYQWQKEHNQPHLCNDCMTIKNRAKEDSITRKCETCGRTFTADRWDEWLFERGYKKAYCDSCRSKRREQISFRCAYCGKESSMSKMMYESQNEHYQPHLCQKCVTISKEKKGRPTSAVCSRCGSTFETNEWEVWLIDNGYKKAKCDECRRWQKERRRLRGY